MPNDFRYSLTRYCLRSGQLTLPGKMMELFPTEGSVIAVDTKEDEELTLELLSPRTVGGLSGFFQTHGLEVNDSLLIRLMDDGRYGLTPVPRVKKPDYREASVREGLLDELFDKATPLSEAEIRGLYPDLPAAFGLAEALAEDVRFTLLEGRWRRKDSLPQQGMRPAEEGMNVDAEQAAPMTPMTEAPSQTDQPAAELKSPSRQGRARVTPYPRGVMFPGDAALNSEQDLADLSLQRRAREILEDLGFQVEGLAHGQLMVRADFGRHVYNALFHMLPVKESLDWAVLLGRRRELGAMYLSVIGDHRDLLRLSNPAMMAQATLWSWDALERVKALTETVLISPVDFETHFERDGLFEDGLARFEKMIQARVAERGLFSEMLARLAQRKAPVIFMLEELMDGSELTREQVLKTLEFLSRAPFHLISRVDDGEFCLRHDIADGLDHLASYAQSLRSQLPIRRAARVQALQVDVEAEDVAPK